MRQFTEAPGARMVAQAYNPRFPMPLPLDAAFLRASDLFENQPAEVI